MSVDKVKDFFISYTGKDRAWAEWIAWVLEDAGYITAMQAWDFDSASNFVLKPHKAAVESTRTIAVLSSDYFESPYTKPEWAEAFANDPTSAHGRLIPVRVEDFKPMGLFSAILYIDLVDLDESKARERLIRSVGHIVSGRRLKPESKPGFPSGASPIAHPTRMPFPSTLPKKSISSGQPSAKQPRATVRLTPTHVHVLRLVAEGFSTELRKTTELETEALIPLPDGQHVPIDDERIVTLIRLLEAIRFVACQERVDPDDSSTYLASWTITDRGRRALEEMVHASDNTNKNQKKNMNTPAFNAKQCQRLEDLIEIEYDKFHDFRREISLSIGNEKILLKQRLKREIVPDLRRLEQEYAELLAAEVPIDAIPEPEAKKLVDEVTKATLQTEQRYGTNAPQEIVKLLSEIRDKLSEPGKSASAKLKVSLPIIPLISSYEMEMDTEGVVTAAWKKARDLFKKLVPRNPK